MRHHSSSFTLVVIAALILTIPSIAQKLKMPTVPSQWFDKQEWLGGLKMAPHSSINKLEFAKQYKLHKAYWDAAFTFLRTHDLASLEKGRHPILGDTVYASVTEDSTKDFANTKWESHRKYADIQSVIRGEEKIGVCDVKKANVTVPYDAAKDIANYEAEGTQYSATPGTFFIFLPGDAHRPNITPGGNTPDKKIVVKVRLAD